MAVPPYSDDPEHARPYFRQLRALREDIKRLGCQFPTLSMGMSHDFEIAIEEGATEIRVGSAFLCPKLRRKIAGAADAACISEKPSTPQMSCEIVRKSREGDVLYGNEQCLAVRWVRFSARLVTAVCALIALAGLFDFARSTSAARPQYLEQPSHRAIRRKSRVFFCEQGDFARIRF